MTLSIVSTFEYIINFLNGFLKEYDLIFYDDEMLYFYEEVDFDMIPWGKEIDIKEYYARVNGYLDLDAEKRNNNDCYAVNFHIGYEKIYKSDIEPNILDTTYENKQFDFLGINIKYCRSKIFAARIKAETSGSVIAKELMEKLKIQVEKFYKIGMKTDDKGFEDANAELFNKYYWSEDIIGKDNIYDYINGGPNLKII